MVAFDVVGAVDVTSMVYKRNGDGLAIFARALHKHIKTFCIMHTQNNMEMYKNRCHFVHITRYKETKAHAVSLWVNP